MGFRFWEHSGPTEAHGRSDNRKSTGHIDDSPEHQEIKEEEDFINKNDPEKRNIYNVEGSYDPTTEMDDKIDRELTGTQTIEDLEEQEAMRDNEILKTNTNDEELSDGNNENHEDKYSEFLVTGRYSDQYADHPEPKVVEDEYFDKLAEEKLGDLDKITTNNLNNKVEANKSIYKLYENPQEKHRYQERGHRKGLKPQKARQQAEMLDQTK